MSFLIDYVVAVIVAFILAGTLLCTYFVYRCMQVLKVLNKDFKNQWFTEEPEKKVKDVPFLGKDGLYSYENEKKKSDREEWV